MRTSMKPRKGTSLRQISSFEPSCMSVRRTDMHDGLREKNTKKKQSLMHDGLTKSLYFTYAWGRPYPTDCNGSSHIGLGHQRNQSCKFFTRFFTGFFYRVWLSNGQVTFATRRHLAAVSTSGLQKSWNTRERWQLDEKCLQNTNSKSGSIYRMVKLLLLRVAT
jgi:hypothetical protein